MTQPLNQSHVELEYAGRFSFLHQNIFFLAAVMLLLGGFNCWLLLTPRMDIDAMEAELKRREELARSLRESMYELDSLMLHEEASLQQQLKQQWQEKKKREESRLKPPESPENKKKEDLLKKRKTQEPDQTERMLLDLLRERESPKQAKVPKRIVEQVRLGKPDAPDRVTLSWISWDDFQRLIARKKPWDQPGLQAKSQRTVSGPVRLDPGDPDGDAGEEGVTQKSQAKQVAQQSEAEKSLKPERTLETEDAKENEANAEEVKSLPSQKNFDQAQTPSDAKPIKTATMQEKAEGEPDASDPDILQAKVKEDTSLEAESDTEAQKGAKTETKAGDPSPAGSALPIKTQSQVAADLRTQNAIAIKPIKPFKRRSYDLTSEKTFEVTGANNKTQPVTEEPKAGKSSGDDVFVIKTAQVIGPRRHDLDDSDDPAETVTNMETVLNDLDQYVFELAQKRKRLKGDGTTSASLSDRESLPVSRISLGKRRMGGVLVSKGLEVKTFMPRLDPIMARMLPHNPTVAILFDENGKVHYARFVRTTRQPSWDAPILNSVYRFRARGPQLKPGHFVQVVITFDLAPE